MNLAVFTGAHNSLLIRPCASETRWNALTGFENFKSESQGQNLVLTVLYVAQCVACAALVVWQQITNLSLPYSYDSGSGTNSARTVT